MDNYVERESYRLACHALDFLDPKEELWAIDAGAGVRNFWFELLYKRGHNVIVVEPFPALPVRERCEKWKIPLVPQALAGAVREYEIFTDGAELHSLLPDLWTCPMKKAGVVPGTTVRAVCRTFGVPLRGPGLVKLDIEGMEPDVINSMLVMEDMTSELVFPAVIVFEFGGQVARRTGTGPWSERAVDRLEDALQVLEATGYHRGFVVSEGGAARTEPFHDPLNVMDLIHPDTAWGNIVIFRVPSVDDMRRWL